MRNAPPWPNAVLRELRRARPRLGLQQRLTVPRPSSVERWGDEETSDHDWAAVWRDVKMLYTHGLHPAIALHVRHRGRVVLDRTVGHLHHDVGLPPSGPVVTPDTLFNMFSASKIITAALVLALCEDGALDLDTPAAHWLPPFGRHGKEHITIKHLLQHTAGIPNMPAGPDFAQMVRTGRIELDALWEMKPTAPPGTDVAYHPISSWIILERVIEAATGEDLRDVLSRRLLQPMGLSHLNYGVMPRDLDRVARHTVTGAPMPPIMASIFQRTIGLDFAAAIQLTNEPAFLQTVLPSANIIGTPREAGAFLQMLLDDGFYGGQQVLRPATVRAMHTDRSPLQRDSTLQFPMQYGLGVMMGGDAFSLYGLGTRDAFGHLGLSTVVVYADPRRDLVVAYLNTGKPMFAHGMVTWYATLQRIVLTVPRIR